MVRLFTAHVFNTQNALALIKRNACAETIKNITKYTILLLQVNILQVKI